MRQEIGTHQDLNTRNGRYMTLLMTRNDRVLLRAIPIANEVVNNYFLLGVRGRFCVSFVQIF